MALPHFTNIKMSSYADPIYLNRFEVKFSDFLNCEYLNDNLTKIDDKYCYFNINEIKGEILVLKFIDDLIKNENKLNVEVFVHSKEGLVLMIIVLEEFQFIKIKKLLDFSYSYKNNISGISKPKVRFKYKKMKLYFDNKKYTRLKKLQKLNSI